MALSTTIDIRIAAALTKVTDLAGIPAIPIVASLNKTLTSGFAAGQADLVFHDQRTLTTGVTEDLDLAGALVNGFGDAQVFVKVKLFWLFSAVANTVDLTVFGDAANVPFLNTAATTTTVKPGGCILFYNPTGFAVTGTTGDIVQIANGAATSIFDVLVIGTSA